MRKRSSAGASEAVASSSGSEAAEEELFAAEPRLGSDHPAAEPAWSDDEDEQFLPGDDAEDSEAESDDSEASDSQSEQTADSSDEVSSAAEGSPSDDDELDTAIVDLASAATSRDAAEQPGTIADTYVLSSYSLLLWCTAFCCAPLPLACIC